MNNKGGPGDNWWGCKKRTIFSGPTGGLDRDKNDLQGEKISFFHPVSHLEFFK